jgi:hypothetical protein
MEGEFDFTFVAQIVVPCDPQSGYTGPEWTGEVSEGVEKAVVDYLISYPEGNIGH